MPDSTIMKNAARTWEDVIGNEEAKGVLMDNLYAIRFRGQTPICKLLLSGSSRTGKSDLTKLFRSCLQCPHLNPDTLNPCWECERCNNIWDRLWGPGLWYEVDVGNGKTNNLTHCELDCRKDNIADDIHRFMEIAKEIRPRGLNVAVLDEAHYLTRKSLDEMLLVPLESTSAMRW